MDTDKFHIVGPVSPDIYHAVLFSSMAIVGPLIAAHQHSLYTIIVKLVEML